MKRLFVFLMLLLPANLFLSSCSGNMEGKDYLVLLNTSMGDIKIKLYNDTPGHRDNFVKLVKEKFYDGIEFHRVINDFMIQAGDPSTGKDTSSVYMEKYDYTIPAEIMPEHFHKKGVLAAARIGDRVNPARRSSGTQFYLVKGQVFEAMVTEMGDTVSADDILNDLQRRVDASLKQAVFYKHLAAERKRLADSGEQKSDAELQEFVTMIAYDEIGEMKPYAMTEEQREVYKTIGGTPHLDMQYTVFGEIVEGLDVVDKISAVQTGPGNKPLDPVIILKAKLVRK